MRRIFATVVCSAVLSSLGCATYLDDLKRAEKHYQENQHERALALLRVLEADTDSFSYAERTRYAYLRGINDYRLSGKRNEDGSSTAVDRAYRAHARHWLSLARAYEQDRPGGMKPHWKANLDEALRDLNQDVYGVGVTAEEPLGRGSAPSKPPAAPVGSTEPPQGQPAKAPGR